MRNLFLFCFVLLISAGGFAQSVDRTLVSSGGAHFETDEYTADVSVGETFISTLAAGEFILTQGFQQTMLTITNVEQLLEIDVKMFPNPTSEYLNVQFPVNDFSTVEIQVIDISGRLISRILLQDELTNIDVFEWKSGTYIFKIIADNELVQTSKVIKK